MRRRATSTSRSTPGKGKVALRGIVLDNEEREQTESVAAAVAGVHSVDNQLRLMTSSRLFASSKQT